MQQPDEKPPLIQVQDEVLRFSIALNQPSMQSLSIRNLSAVDAVAFKIKTTNPRRYSVRPNIGLVWAGESSSVTVQVPAMPTMPPDASKCKDKFQVLSTKLGADDVVYCEAAAAAPEAAGFSPRVQRWCARGGRRGRP